MNYCSFFPTTLADLAKRKLSCGELYDSFIWPVTSYCTNIHSPPGFCAATGLLLATLWVLGCRSVGEAAASGGQLGETGRDWERGRETAGQGHPGPCVEWDRTSAEGKELLGWQKAASAGHLGGTAWRVWQPGKVGKVQ